MMQEDLVDPPVSTELHWYDPASTLPEAKQCDVLIYREDGLGRRVHKATFKVLENADGTEPDKPWENAVFEKRTNGIVLGREAVDRWARISPILETLGDTDE